MLKILSLFGFVEWMNDLPIYPLSRKETRLVMVTCWRYGKSQWSLLHYFQISPLIICSIMLPGTSNCGSHVWRGWLTSALTHPVLPFSKTYQTICHCFLTESLNHLSIYKCMASHQVSHFHQGPLPRSGSAGHSIMVSHISSLQAFLLTYPLK